MAKNLNRTEYFRKYYKTNKVNIKMKHHLLRKPEFEFPFENVIHRTGFFIMEKESFVELHEDPKFSIKWNKAGLVHSETQLGKIKIRYA